MRGAARDWLLKPGTARTPPSHGLLLRNALALTNPAIPTCARFPQRKRFAGLNPPMMYTNDVQIGCKIRAKRGQKHAKTTLFRVLLLLFADFQASFFHCSAHPQGVFFSNWNGIGVFAVLQVNKYVHLQSAFSTSTRP